MASCAVLLFCWPQSSSEVDVSAVGAGAVQASAEVLYNRERSSGIVVGAATF